MAILEAGRERSIRSAGKSVVVALGVAGMNFLGVMFNVGATQHKNWQILAQSLKADPESAPAVGVIFRCAQYPHPCECCNREDLPRSSIRREISTKSLHSRVILMASAPRTCGYPRIFVCIIRRLFPERPRYGQCGGIGKKEQSHWVLHPL